MQGSTKKMLAASVCIALLMALLIFLHSESDSRKDVISQDSPEELDPVPPAIVAGIKKSAEKFRSGRIVYTVVRTVSPSRHTDEYIESHLKKQEEIFRSDPKVTMSEKEIHYLLEQERESMKKAQKQTEDSTLKYSGEYIFEGDNYYHIVEFPSWGRTVKRYAYENKMTTFDSSTEEKSPPPSVSIRRGVSDGWSELYSPLSHFLIVTSRFTGEGWRMSGTEETNGSITLTKDFPGWKTEMDVLPEKDYYVSRYRSSRRPDNYRHLSFDKMEWNPDLGGYYPREIREERFNKEGIGPERDIETIYVEEAEFNKDYDDSIFKPVFEEGIRISDSRFDPPKFFRYQHPDYADEYLAQLDEEAKLLEKRKEKQAIKIYGGIRKTNR